MCVNGYSLYSISDPPGEPQILGLSSGEVLQAGSLKRLTCTSMAGNPLAHLTWYLGDRFLKSEYSTRDNYAFAELNFQPRPEDNGLELRCEASSPALLTSISVGIDLIVDFAPINVKISLDPDRPRAGHNVTLTCETDLSRPPAEVTWWHNGEKLLGANEVILDKGDFGGSITVSKLSLTLTAQHHDAVVTCDARNPNILDRAHDAITLSVNRKSNNFICGERKKDVSF